MLCVVEASLRSCLTGLFISFRRFSHEFLNLVFLLHYLQQTESGPMLTQWSRESPWFLTNGFHSPFQAW